MITGRGYFATCIIKGDLFDSALYLGIFVYYVTTRNFGSIMINIRNSKILTRLPGKYLQLPRKCLQLWLVLRVAVICDILTTFPGCYPTHYQGCY